MTFSWDKWKATWQQECHFIAFPIDTDFHFQTFTHNRIFNIVLYFCTVSVSSKRSEQGTGKAGAREGGPTDGGREAGTGVRGQ